jgi:glycosyltransferase involved in cell wall biosynthesis
LYKWIYRFFKMKEDEAIRLADYNTCLTKKAEAEIRSWSRVSQPVRLEVIPCSVDMQQFDPEAISVQQQAKMRDELGLKEGEMVISYLGSIGGWYLSTEMMQCCRAIMDAHTRARFLFISNNRHQVIQKAAADAGIPADRIIIRFGKRHEVPVLLSLSSHSLFFIKPCYSKISSAPTKQAEIMAMGIPIITNRGVGDVAEIIEENNAGFILPDFSPASMQHVAGAIQPDDREKKGYEIRKAALAYFDLQKAVADYARVYQAIFRS